MKCTQDEPISSFIAPIFESESDHFISLEGDLDAPCVPFPSLEPRNKRNSVKRQRRDKTEPIHHLASAISLNTSSLIAHAKQLMREEEELLKTSDSAGSSSVDKKSVGRPRLYPKKIADPNKPKRGYLQINSILEYEYQYII